MPQIYLPRLPLPIPIWVEILFHPQMMTMALMLFCPMSSEV
jgi:hypothetical protein